jgi:hypothetical protein
MLLREHMLSLCSPLWWESERKFVVHSGSMCVVKTPKAVFGIANNHVFEQYRKDMANMKDVFCQLGSGPFDPIENIISYNWYWDLATFRIPSLTLKHFNHKILPHDQWPPALLQTTDHVAYGGYPEDRRFVSQGDRPEKMTADLVSFRGTPNGCGETNVSLQIDPAKLTWLPNVHEPLKGDANFSGMSGGPCFRLISAENRIELADGKDEFGMPLARIVHSFDQDAVALWNANFEEGLAIAKATGAKEFWSARGNQPTIHLFGGTIMGSGAGDSVTDSYGQTHEIPNLWVAGPGLFPTEGASNPTYTIFAVSQRGAEQLVSKWGTVAG